MEADGPSYEPAISADGRTVAFASEAFNLVSSDTNGAQDVFAHDRTTGITRRVSLSNDGVEGNNTSATPSISGDGNLVAFDSFARNLVSGDTNNLPDAFVYDLEASRIRCVSLANSGQQGNNVHWSPKLTANGRFVSFDSASTNLVLGDLNGQFDVFLHQYGPNLIAGRVVFSDLDSAAVTPSSCLVDFRDVSGVTVQTRPAVLDASGNFSLIGPDTPGTYFVSVKHSHWLRKTVGPFDTSSDISGVLIVLRNGDIDGDNEVAIGDYAILSGSYGSSAGDPNWATNADLNGDSSVDIGDYAILSANYGLVGDN